MIYGLRGRLRFLVQLMADVVKQGGLGDIRQRLHRLLQPPAGEVHRL